MKTDCQGWKKSRALPLQKGQAKLPMTPWLAACSGTDLSACQIETSDA